MDSRLSDDRHARGYLVDDGGRNRSQQSLGETATLAPVPAHYDVIDGGCLHVLRNHVDGLAPLDDRFDRPIRRIGVIPGTVEETICSFVGRLLSLVGQLEDSTFAHGGVYRCDHVEDGTWTVIDREGVLQCLVRQGRPIKRDEHVGGHHMSV